MFARCSKTLTCHSMSLWTWHKLNFICLTSRQKEHRQICLIDCSYYCTQRRHGRALVIGPTKALSLHLIVLGNKSFMAVSLFQPIQIAPSGRAKVWTHAWNISGGHIYNILWRFLFTDIIEAETPICFFLKTKVAPMQWLYLSVGESDRHRHRCSAGASPYRQTQEELFH